MKQLQQPPDKPQSAQFTKQASYFVVGGEVGCLTLIIVIAAVFGGLYLDKLLGTKPVIMLLLVLGSAPLALFLTFWVAKREINRYTPHMSSTPAQPTKTYDEEDKSD